MARWDTREDAFRDMAEVTGDIGSHFDDYDYGVVTDGRAPPVMREIVDSTEMEYLFGGREDNRTDNIDVRSKIPDFQGIQQMLQLVKSEAESDIEDEPIDESKKSVITISKLNPSVPEFIPKALAVKSESENSITDKKPDKTSNTNETVTVKDASVKGNTDNKIPERVKNKRNTSEINDEKVELLSKELKKTINEASKQDNWQSKRSRNVAITALLNLYTEPVLLPPAYFEKEPEKPVDPLPSENSPEDVSHCNGIVYTSESKAKDKTLAEKKENNDSLSTKYSKESNKNNERIDRAVHEDSNDIVSSKQIKDSIEKVKGWLGKTEKPKCAPMLGPVTFKRKEIASPKTTSEGSVKSMSMSTIEQHIPGSKEKELYEKYAESIRKQTKVTPWTKLEEELQRRDEICRKKKLEELNGTASG